MASNGFVRALGALFAAFFGLAVPVIHSQQAPAQKTFSLLGRVIDGVTNQPIAGAFVNVASSPTRNFGQPTVVADAQGRFVFRDLPAGIYEPSATARGYLNLTGQSVNGVLTPPVTIELSESTPPSNVTVRLWPPARISGTVTDDLGDPVEGLQLGILRVEYIAGHRRLRVATGTICNDRGVYTSYRLAPGTYTVGALIGRTTIPVSTRELIDRLSGASAADQNAIEQQVRASGAMADFRAAGYRIGDFFLTPGLGGASVGPAPLPDGTVLTAPALFYPGVSSAMEAQAITVRAGEHHDAVNLQVRLAPSVRVSGRVTGPSGPLANIGIRLLPEGTDALVSDLAFEQSSTISNDAGEFSFLGVPAGRYAVKAYWLPPVQTAGPGTVAQPTDDPTLSGSVAVTVSRTDVNNVMLSLKKGPTLQGRLVFDGNIPPPPADQLARAGALQLELADGRAFASPPMPRLRTWIESNGQFRSGGLPAGRYVLRISGFPGWSMESAMLNGKDVSEEAFDADSDVDLTGLVVTLTNVPAGVTGTVRTSSGAVATGAQVLLYSTNPAHWADRGETPRRLLRAVTSKTGSYTFAGLPPGEYFMLATEDALPDDWAMRDFLTTSSRQATRVIVERRATRSVPLTASSLPRRGGQ